MVRIKHRYLLVNFLYPPSQTTTPGANKLPELIQIYQPSSDKLTPQFLSRIIKDGVAELFGDYGAGVVANGLSIKYLSTSTSTAIIRVARDHYRLVWAALSFITWLPKPIAQNCVARVVRVSGTIRKSEDEVIKMAKELILRTQGGSESSSERKLDPTLNFIEAPATEDKMEGIKYDSSDEEDGDSDSNGNMSE